MRWPCISTPVSPPVPCDTSTSPTFHYWWSIRQHFHPCCRGCWSVSALWLLRATTTTLWFHNAYLLFWRRRVWRRRRLRRLHQNKSCIRMTFGRFTRNVAKWWMQALILLLALIIISLCSTSLLLQCHTPYLLLHHTHAVLNYLLWCGWTPLSFADLWIASCW